MLQRQKVLKHVIKDKYTKRRDYIAKIPFYFLSAVRFCIPVRTCPNYRLPSTPPHIHHAKLYIYMREWSNDDDLRRRNREYSCRKSREREKNGRKYEGDDEPPLSHIRAQTVRSPSPFLLSPPVLSPETLANSFSLALMQKPPNSRVSYFSQSTSRSSSSIEIGSFNDKYLKCRISFRSSSSSRSICRWHWFFNLLKSCHRCEPSSFLARNLGSWFRAVGRDRLRFCFSSWFFDSIAV